MNSYDFRLKNGTKVIQTSPHGVRFNDGTIFNPSEEWKSNNTWVKVLNVKREFREVDGFLVKTTKSTQTLTSEAVVVLKEFKNENVLILVSFMILLALKEMGIRNEFPYVVGVNSTILTARSKPSDKIYDVDNFAW